MLTKNIDIYARFQNECADVFIETAQTYQEIDRKLVAICGDQFNFIANRSNTIIELIKIHALWDAQILVRPIIESCIKICFICFSPASIRAELCYEYEEVLGVINSLKLHDKAAKTLQAAGEESGHSTLSALLLTDERLAELRNKLPKEKRKEVESRWGFTRIMVELDKQFKNSFGLTPFTNFSHTYGLSSHLIHADEMGLGAMRARARLKEPKLSVIEHSHQIALLDAMAGSSTLSAMALAWASAINLDKATMLIETYKQVHSGTY
jgi:hypothetical protein